MSTKRQSEKMVYKMINAYKCGKHTKANFYSKIIRIIFAMDIVPSIKLGTNVEFVHNGLGCVFHPKTIIGDNCKIYQNVTIGGNGKIVNNKKNSGAPEIEDNVAIFAGACVLGPIKIGRNSIIGANSVVTKNVPPNSLVVGNPAVIKELNFKYDFD